MHETDDDTEDQCQVETKRIEEINTTHCERSDRTEKNTTSKHSFRT